MGRDEIAMMMMMMMMMMKKMMDGAGWCGWADLGNGTGRWDDQMREKKGEKGGKDDEDSFIWWR